MIYTECGDTLKGKDSWRDNMLINPYTPGAGTPPEFLAGRDDLLEKADISFKQLKGGGMAQHTIYYGVRGVGKTVLLTEVESLAKANGCLYTQIECDESFDFIKSININCKSFIKQLSIAESLKGSLKDHLDRAKAVLMSFKATYSPNDNSVSFELSDELKKYGDADTGDITTDLIRVFTSLGSLAKSANTPICFFIDEIQAIKKEYLLALIASVHRTNQQKLPILINGAGLPTILRISGDAKSYAERLFDFVKISNLKEPDAFKALIEPAKKSGVNYEQLASEFVLNETGCYPYFIQQYGQIIWKYVDENLNITKKYVELAYEEYIEKLNDSFFGVRFNRSTKAEKNFLYAMVSCGAFPCSISDVAKHMGKKQSSISLLRNNLINKGLIYSPSFGEVDFTVPQFDEFLKRFNPKLQAE